MVVARYTHGQLVILDRLREMVRLGAGARGRRPARTRTWPRARWPASNASVSACATCGPTACAWSAPTRCGARKRKEAFIERAREALGHPIEIVSGIEEARLIYSGVAHTMPAGPGRRLVCDIGGGSTEIVIGEGLEPLRAREPADRLRAPQRRVLSPTGGSRRSACSARGRGARRASSRTRRAFRRRGWDERSAARAPCAPSATASASSIRPRSTSAPTASSASSTSSAALEHIRDLKLNCAHGRSRAVVRGRRGDPRRGVRAARHRDHARGRRRDARGPAVRPARPLHRRGRARAHRAQHAGALSRRSRRRPNASKRRRSISRAGRRSLVARRIRRSNCCCAGPRDCTRSASTSRTAAITATAPICWRMRTWPGFRARNRSCSAHHGGQPSAQACDRGGETSCTPPWDKRAPAMTVLLRLAVLLHRGRSSVALPHIKLTARADVAGDAVPGRLARRSPARRSPTCSRKSRTCKASASGCASSARSKPAQGTTDRCAARRRNAPAARLCIARRVVARARNAYRAVAPSDQACVLSAR